MTLRDINNNKNFPTEELIYHQRTPIQNERNIRQWNVSRTIYFHTMFNSLFVILLTSSSPLGLSVLLEEV